MIKVALHITETLAKVRRALASRYLFDNWLSLLIKYALIKIGFNVKLTAKVDNCAFELSPETFGCLVGNASRGLIKLIECNGHKAVVIYASGIQVPVKYFEKGDACKIDLAIKNGWVYDFTNGFWFKNGVKFRHMHWLILDIFDYGEYESLNVVGKVVVDVGAYVGDSAIYFALKGAKRVIAVEPHSGAFAEMLDNIKLNSLEGMIIPVNAGLASKPGKLCIKKVSVSATYNIYHKPGDCPNAIPAMTLSELISRFSVEGNDTALKMDCEGCEFDVILNDYEHVRLFRELILEYHPNPAKKTVDDLLMTLSRDYKCEVRGGQDLGIIHCTRK